MQIASAMDSSLHRVSLWRNEPQNLTGNYNNILIQNWEIKEKISHRGKYIFIVIYGSIGLWHVGNWQ